MRSVPVRAAGLIAPSLVAEAAAIFAGCHTLAHLMRWCENQSPRAQVSEIVTQDEYTHDVVLPFGAAFLAFDTT
jgi:hypothetical protein